MLRDPHQRFGYDAEWARLLGIEIVQLKSWRLSKAERWRGGQVVEKQLDAGVARHGSPFGAEISRTEFWVDPGDLLAHDPVVKQPPYGCDACRPCSDHGPAVLSHFPALPAWVSRRCRAYWHRYFAREAPRGRGAVLASTQTW